MFFYDPNSTVRQIVTWETTSSQSGYVQSGRGFGIENSTTAKHGLRFGVSSGTCTAAGHYALYGYKI